VTEIAEQPVAEQLDRGLSPPAAAEEPVIGQTGAALFPQLVWAHYRWERGRRRREPDAALEREFLAKLDEFQREEGPLVQVYWSTRKPSAVAMTVHRGARTLMTRLRLAERDDIVRLHRVTDWVTRDARPIADLLHECDLLAIRAGEVLRGTSEQIVLRWILNIQMHLLGFFERADRVTEKAAADLARAEHRNLADAEAYYQRAASRAGRIVFVSGMLMGLVVAALFGVVLGLLLWLAGLGGDLQRLLLCFGAGAVGALLSTVSRMGKSERGRFNIDFELGRPLVRRLGVYRPLVGAVGGIAIAFLLDSGLLQLDIDDANKPYYYGFAAFLAGFSERFATVMFGTAESRLARREKEGDHDG